jgi:hypothetical protein
MWQTNPLRSTIVPLRWSSSLVTFGLRFVVTVFLRHRALVSRLLVLGVIGVVIFVLVVVVGEVLLRRRSGWLVGGERLTVHEKNSGRRRVRPAQNRLSIDIVRLSCSFRT